MTGLFFLAGCGQLCVGFNYAYLWLLLVCSGEHIKGHVVARWIETRMDNEGEQYPVHCLKFCFQPAAHPVEGTAEIKESVYQRLQEGDDVLVEFVAWKPSLCSLVPWSPAPSGIKNKKGVCAPKAGKAETAL